MLLKQSVLLNRFSSFSPYFFYKSLRFKFDSPVYHLNYARKSCFSRLRLACVQIHFLNCNIVNHLFLHHCSLCIKFYAQETLQDSNKCTINDWSETVAARLYCPQPLHQSPEQTFVFVMIAETNSCSPRMTPDLRRYEQKAQPRGC